MVHTLDTLRRGTQARIISIDADPDSVRSLRRMGLREGLTVEVMSHHDPMMIRFDGCCLALRRGMLEAVTAYDCGHERAPINDTGPRDVSVPAIG